MKNRALYNLSHHIRRKGPQVFSLLTLGLSPMLVNAQTVVEPLNQQLIIDDIVCEGNVTTECDFITKKYYQKPGEVLNPDEIADAKLRLGTLIQFRTINTRLAKGHQRGHVVVIFEVQEAQNIQYQFGGSYSVSKVTTHAPYCFEEVYPYSGYSRSCQSIDGDVNGPGLQASVTDFNFLGSGKQLSFGISGRKWSDGYTVTSSLEREGQDIQYLERELNTGSTNYTFSAEYYDPHLFDTDFYYFRAHLNHTRGRYHYDRRLTEDQQLTDEEYSISRSKATPVNLEVGRRFGSHSYVSLDIGGYFTSTDNTNGIGINYGWDSQDDSIFPTQGSVFSSSFRFRRQHIDEGTFALHYQKHFEVAENQVLTLGNYSLFAPVDRTLDFDHQLTSEFTARYTNINTVDQLEGIYSGWFVEAALGGTTKSGYSPRQIKYGLRAGYTYQSDSMIYRLSIGYDHQERN